MAIGAHPDDIEFMMAGTLMLLGEAGCPLHYMNLSSGNCGSLLHDADALRKIRREEAQEAAAIMGATFHEGFCDDLEIVYEVGLLRKLAAVIRAVEPAILLVPSPQDYMEDHVNTCRLAVTAAFARCLKNFQTDPPRAHTLQDVTLYHAMPHGLRDPLGARISPGWFVDTEAVHEQKRKALSCHRSQQDWLDASQQINSYLQTMTDFSLEVGEMSGRYLHAEGWRRHLHYGFCSKQADPLKEMLGSRCSVNHTND